MANKEKFKSLYDNKFNKEKNYDDILKKTMNTKKSILKSHHKLVLIPCLTVICLISILIFNNKNSNLKDDRNIKNKEIPKENILGGGNYMELSWAFNVSDTKKIFDYADYIIKARIIDIEEGFFREDNWHYPVTPFAVETLEVLKGNENVKISEFYKHGGYVTIEQIINSHPDEWNKKYELYKYSEEDRKIKYWYYEEPGHYDLEIGKEYIIALSSKNDDGICYIAANGYGIFDIVDNVYKNVLTGNELVIE